MDKSGAETLFEQSPDTCECHCHASQPAEPHVRINSLSFFNARDSVCDQMISSSISYPAIALYSAKVIAGIDFLSCLNPDLPKVLRI